MNILSCNIRYYNAADGPNHWPFRKDLCMEVIRSRQPDIVCLQEAWREQLADLRLGLPEFDAVGMVDEPLGWNPVNTILYRRERFKAIAQGGYWLSEQPHVSGSRSWDSGSVRLANWLRLEDRVMKTEFRVVNTHLDDASQLARENQARVICEDAAVYPEHYPQLLTGDMNADGLNRAIQMFKREGWVDTYEAIHGSADLGHTFHAFKGEAFESDGGRIDWIFVKGQTTVVDAEVIKDERSGQLPSDHYFVGAEVHI